MLRSAIASAGASVARKNPAANSSACQPDPRCRCQARAAAKTAAIATPATIRAVPGAPDTNADIGSGQTVLPAYQPSEPNTAVMKGSGVRGAGVVITEIAA